MDTSYQDTLNIHLSHYYQATVMGRGNFGPPAHIVADYRALCEQDPGYTEVAVKALSATEGIDPLRCAITANNREFLTQVLAANTGEV
jgi:hypothetical protein